MKKPDWRRKITEKEIIAKWRGETGDDLRDEVFKYAIDELGFLAEYGNPEVGVEPTGVDLVWVSF